MKLTKITVKRLNKNSDGILWHISEMLQRAGVLLGESGHYVANDNDPYIPMNIVNEGTDFEYISTTTDGTYQRRLVAGLATRFPRWISGTFTHGNNGVQIYDVNSLVRELAKECA